MPPCIAYWTEQVADECVLTDGNKESPKTLGFLAQLYGFHHIVRKSAGKKSEQQKVIPDWAQKN